MCAITGKIVFARNGHSPREAVRAMTAALAHRGPDGSGLHSGPNVALGHRRLDGTGHARDRQPLSNAAGTVWVTFDGEVLNARDLRHQLQARGRSFKTTTSAEVVVQGYEEWGDHVVDRLRGPFALAVWDAQRNRLLLARDRLGFKPLCYAALEGHTLVFASELRALLEDSEVPRDWDPAAVKEYLALGYVPAPATIFRRIVKLPAGHLLVAEHGRIRVSRYWDIPGAAGGKSRREEEYLEQLEALLGEVARTHGGGESVTYLLSPGEGSVTLLASLDAADALPESATTATLHRRPSRDVEQSRAIAAHFGCEHRVELVALRLADLVPRLSWHFDDPLADPSAITAYHLAAAARAQAPVALTAAGTSDVWAGLPSHRRERAEGRARRWLGPLGIGVGLVGRMLPLPFDLVRTARHLGLAQAEACARNRSALGQPVRSDRLCTHDFLRATRGVDAFCSLRETYDVSGARDPLARALYVDLKTRVADHVLVRLDRMAVAASVQLRLPMLDHKLVEFAASLPSHFKLRGKQSRYLLRRLLDGRVSPKLLRRSADPFEATPSAWLRGPLASLASDVLLSGRFRHRGIFDSRAVTRAWQAHLTGRRDYHRELWSLLMLELWFEHFVDGAERRARAAA